MVQREVMLEVPVVFRQATHWWLAAVAAALKSGVDWEELEFHPVTLEPRDQVYKVVAAEVLISSEKAVVAAVVGTVVAAVQGHPLPGLLTLTALAVVVDLVLSLLLLFSSLTLDQTRVIPLGTDLLVSRGKGRKSSWC